MTGPTPDPLRALLETKSALLTDVESLDDSEERLLVRSDLSGTMQLYELLGGGPLVQLTALADPVARAAYVPRRPQAVAEVDATGDERHQLYLVDLQARRLPARTVSELGALTSEPAYGHHLAGVAPSGDEVAYVSNKRNNVDFDLWVCDLGTGEHRMLYADGGWCQPASGYSPDGRYVTILRPGPRPLDSDLLLVDTRTGEHRVVLAHPDQAAEVGFPAWTANEGLFVACDVSFDHSRVVYVDVETGRARTVPHTGEHWDAHPVTSPDGTTLLVVENRDGASAMRVLDAQTFSEEGEVPTVEPGVVSSYIGTPPKLSRDGKRVYYTLTTPRQAADVWMFDRTLGTSTQLTTSPAQLDHGRLARLEAHRTESFDAEVVPLFAFRPEPAGESGGAPPPVVVLVHGGPESQSMQSFNPVVQGLVARGYGVVVPNVRGSTGYGKRYASLDDTTRRLDSVHDLAAVHAWLSSAGFDDHRAALWGGSYGGYMVLAGLAFQPELWAAGVDIVGISDLVTFLEHTSDYRRAHREREYGSLTTDRAFLEMASPLRRADAIRAPLFVVHGRNDPRVPLSEAQQLVRRLEERGVRCELSVYDDEGHGLARLPNRIDAYVRAVTFLDEVLCE